MSASHRRMVRREEGTWRKLQPETPRQETHQPLLSSPVTSPQPARPGVTPRPQQETAKQLERQREARRQAQARARQYQTMRPPAAPALRAPASGRPGTLAGTIRRLRAPGVRHVRGGFRKNVAALSGRSHSRVSNGFTAALSNCLCPDGLQANPSHAHSSLSGRVAHQRSHR